jgi:hypothetical protein
MPKFERLLIAVIPNIARLEQIFYSAEAYHIRAADLEKEGWQIVSEYDRTWLHRVS